MMKRYISLFLFAISAALWCRADINTDKAMNKISRDTKTYISAEARATTEQEAYDTAMEELSAQIADYYKTVLKAPLPDGVYLSNLSAIYDRLTSQVSNNRYRVMLYVRKSDVKALGDSNGSVVLSRGEDDNYNVVTTAPTDPVVVTDTIETIKTVVKPLNPTLSTICQAKTREDVTKLLPELKKSNQISGAALFPVASLDDFYLVVISADNAVTALLHYDGAEYADVMSGESIDISQYSNCYAYWFTLSKQ